MAECSKCGEDAMTFTCKYCGEKFCSKHRLPENHECDSMEEEIEKQKDKENSDQWFQENEVRNPAPSQITKKKRKPSILDEIRNTLSRNYTLSIIGITVFVYLIQLVVGIGPQSNNFYDLLVLQPGIEQVISQPWTLVSVMFLHANEFHLFANMITLYFFGTAVEKSIGSKNFLKFYFASGIAASIGFIVVRNILAFYQGSSVLGPAVGASGAVVAMFAVVAMLYPEAEVLLYFIFPMKIKTALYAFGGLEAFNLAAKTLGVYLPVIGGFASSAHLAGLIAGIWYGKKLQDKYGRRTSVLNPLGY
jgi:membrane associated rhomboid family serine protease